MKYRPVTRREHEVLVSFTRRQSKRLRELEKMIDTRNTVWWKRIVFRIDGWSAWYVVDEKPRWRPWRKWWTS